MKINFENKFILKINFVQLVSNTKDCLTHVYFKSKLLMVSHHLNLVGAESLSQTIPVGLYIPAFKQKIQHK